jgi:hypothetical protein
MELDLATRWMLWFFGALAIGGAVGFVVARLSSFGLGLGVGLLIPGIVSLSFTFAFVQAFRELAYDPRRLAGTVVAVEDRAVNDSGSITAPVAIVEYAARDGGRRRVDGPRSSSLQEGDEVAMVPRLGTPSGFRIGLPREMRGGAIASMLFGTFPFSAGVFFLVSALAGEPTPRQEQRRIERQERSYLNWAANVLMAAGILATPLFSDPVDRESDRGVAHAIMLGFGVVSLGLWAHVVSALRVGRDIRFTLGLGVLAVNFSAWVVALWFLTDPSAGW